MGIVKWIFNRILVSKLKNDLGFISAVKNADGAAEDLRCAIKSAEESGIVIPDSMKKSAGMEVKGKNE